MTGTPQRLDQEITFDDGADGWLSGHLFTAGGERRGLLQVLLHGNSYDHRYWDAEPLGAEDYSYSRHMAGLGYDVLAVDLPGTGTSSRPAGDAVTADVVADGLAGLVHQITGGRSPVRGAVDRTALVGHSLGTILAIAVQARRTVADVVVGTGTGYAPNRFPPPFAPGVREEAMRTEYAALPPAERARVFYHAPTTDPAMIEYDNRVLYSTLPRRLWAEALELRDDPARNGVADVTCPVLLQFGEFDQIMPASLAEAERAHWPAASDVVVEQLEAVGHSFALHRGRQHGWNGIDRFLRI